MSAGGSADGAVSSINNNHLLILGIIYVILMISLVQLLQVSVQYVLLYGELMLYVV